MSRIADQTEVGVTTLRVRSKVKRRHYIGNWALVLVFEWGR